MHKEGETQGRYEQFVIVLPHLGRSGLPVESAKPIGSFTTLA